MYSFACSLEALGILDTRVSLLPCPSSLHNGRSSSMLRRTGPTPRRCCLLSFVCLIFFFCFLGSMKLKAVENSGKPDATMTRQGTQSFHGPTLKNTQD
ncbi:hypothetical protein FJTKL_13776 [Diaporthe vaccinii]|uniref:Transmembrane protein n=1 Tax=Diaporthe vaccinii TaxID=105482 RepID=A0ABR4F8T1_9PEZI